MGLEVPLTQLALRCGFKAHGLLRPFKGRQFVKQFVGWKLSWLWDLNPQPTDYKSQANYSLQHPTTLLN